MRLVVEIPSESALCEFAGRLAESLWPGAVVGLIGELGAGKTRLVQETAAALGCPPESVSSPTFTLIHEYPGRIPLRHCDAYRLKSAEEFYDLGLDELFDPDGVAFVEWANRVTEYLPSDTLWIEILVTGPSSRRLVLEGPDALVKLLTNT